MPHVIVPLAERSFQALYRVCKGGSFIWDRDIVGLLRLAPVYERMPYTIDAEFFMREKTFATRS